MSLDLYMAIKSCEHCGHVETTDSLNITYNLAPMWYEAFPISDQMIDIDEMPGEEAEVILTLVLNSLKNFPDRFIAINPTNGWGSYEDFVKYIEKLIAICKEHPDGIWKSDR